MAQKNQSRIKTTYNKFNIVILINNRLENSTSKICGKNVDSKNAKKKFLTLRLQKKTKKKSPHKMENEAGEKFVDNKNSYLENKAK